MLKRVTRLYTNQVSCFCNANMFLTHIQIYPGGKTSCISFLYKQCQKMCQGCKVFLVFGYKMERKKGMKKCTEISRVCFLRILVSSVTTDSFDLLALHYTSLPLPHPLYLLLPSLPSPRSANPTYCMGASSFHNLSWQIFCSACSAAHLGEDG